MVSSITSNPLKHRLPIHSAFGMIIASVSGGGNNADTGYWVDEIVVVLIFLSLLILLQQLIKNNKLGIQGHFSQKKRIKLVEDLGVSSTEILELSE